MARQRFWSRAMGFPQRPLPAGRVTPAEPEATPVARPPAVAPAGPAPGPATLEVGLIGEGASDEDEALVQVARLFGLAPRTAKVAEGEALLAAAIRGAWPLIAVSIEGLRSVPAAWPPLLRSYLATGGTLFLQGLESDANPVLERLGASLDLDLPTLRPLAGGRAEVTFVRDRQGFADVLAGMRVDGVEAGAGFEGAGPARALAAVSAGGLRLLALVETEHRGGRVVLSAGGRRLRGRLADAFGPAHALTLLPPMMLMRRRYGCATWRAPFALANFTVDDPVLHGGLLGLDYIRALAQARSHEFHLTVATVPRELPLAEPAVVRLLVEHPDRLSACYHGNDHDGYEFFISEERRVRFRNRPLARQERDLREAAERGRAFAAATGCRLDRVMVFPHGLCPDPLLPRLGEAGFLASCNWLDRYPLGAPAPEDFDLGMRPADVAWHGFPLLWRRDLEDRTFAFDLFLGRPVVIFAHRKDLGPDLDPLVRRAGEINRLGPVVWCGLEPLAQHAYLQRREPAGGGWQVLMTTNEACLHNPDPEPRVYRVRRPHRPAGTTLESSADGGTASDEPEVTVQPGATVLVRLRHPGGMTLPSAGRCPIAVAAASA